MAKAKKELWRNRKIETKRMRVGDVLPHPMNPKIHGENQLAPLRGLLETVGKLDDLKAYYSERNEGKLTFFDGHGRMSLDPAEEWDVDVYDLTDAEADLAVATFDPIAYQAQMRRERLDELLREVSTGDEGLQKLISEMAEKEGLYLSETDAGSESQDADTSSQVGALQFRVIIICTSEMQQSELLERFESEGLNCQALIS